MNVRKNKIVSLFFIINIALILPADETLNTLERILNFAGIDSGIIDAKKSYNIALIEQKYRYLQWWNPVVSFKNDIVYPYKRDAFDNLATSNTTSLVFSAPLPTGTIIDLTTGYVLGRNMVDLETWGFVQDIQGKIGVGQSLNPWWIHTKRNPYTVVSELRTSLAGNDYNGMVKTVMFSCVKNFIYLRKAERNRNMVNERLELYNDMITAYRQMQAKGGISWREFNNVQKDKWQDEQTFFSLEQDINTLKGELYQITGIQVENISNEDLIATDSDFWSTLFLNISRENINKIEETTVRFQKEILRVDRYISRQNNAPLLKFELGTAISLPVKKTGFLDDAWEKENFDDNLLNNWAFTVSVDLSSLFSPLNKKNELTYNLSYNALDELLLSIKTDKDKERIKNTATIKQLEDHITHLKVIIQNEEQNIRDNKLLSDRGAITELEYRQSLLEYKSQCTLLEDFTDELWLYRFLESFYL